MKILLENTGQIVESAFFEQNDKSLSLFINTRHRDILPDYVESEIIARLDRYCFGWADKQEAVSLIAENDADIAALNRLVFSVHDKDQLWYLYLADDVYDTRK